MATTQISKFNNVSVSLTETGWWLNFEYKVIRRDFLSRQKFKWIIGKYKAAAKPFLIWQLIAGTYVLNQFFSPMNFRPMVAWNLMKNKNFEKGW